MAAYETENSDRSGKIIGLNLAICLAYYFLNYLVFPKEMLIANLFAMFVHMVVLLLRAIAVFRLKEKKNGAAIIISMIVILLTGAINCSLSSWP